ncbi:MAG: class II aldolase/adducin family protein [Acetobacteraceae bacterium]
MSPGGEDGEFGALRALSARIGADPRLVQAAGGNTSLKHEGLLWVKASGTWLAQAETRAILVPVRLGPLRAALAAGDTAAESALGFVDPARNPEGLRPSIETALHAALPHRVVVHVHCVDTIAHAIEVGAEARLAPLLAGLSWRFIPYARPGVPLAAAIGGGSVRYGAAADVLVLGNHGLVVGGETVAAAEALLRDVCRRLARPARVAAAAEEEARLARLAEGTGWRVAPAAVHGTATDPAALAVARRGSLYPDHVIYLGPGVLVVEAGESLGAALALRQAAGGPEPPLALVPGAGALMSASASAGEVALAQCLADVTLRVPEGARVSVLGPAAEAELLGWDAEAYRRALERKLP